VGFSNESKVNSVHFSNPLKEGLKKRKLTVFHVKVDFFLRNSATNFLCVKTFSSRAVMQSLACLTVHKWLVGDMSFYEKFWDKVTYFLQNRRLSIDFDHSTSTVIPSEKVQLGPITNRNSVTGFPVSLRWTAYIASKPPPCSVVSLWLLRH